MWDRVPDRREVKIKSQSPYWRVENILKSLRLRFRKVDQDTSFFHYTIPDFGIVLRLNMDVPMLKYTDWTVIDVDMNSLELNEAKLGNKLMWTLISKGYMAYLRNNETGDSKKYRNLLIDQGWGLKIIDMRLELYANKAEHKFLIEHNKRLRSKSIHYILTHYPDFFDYLW